MRRNPCRSRLARREDTAVLERNLIKHRPDSNHANNVMKRYIIDKLASANTANKTANKASGHHFELMSPRSRQCPDSGQPSPRNTDAQSQFGPKS